MQKRTLVILLRLALLVALAATAALFVDYQHAGDPAFCGRGSGCMAVRMSPYSKLGGDGGIPLPTVGLGAFTGLFVLAILARTRQAHRLVAAFAAGGAAIACVLIGLQATVIGAFCKWCVAADVSAIVAAVAAFLLYRRSAQAEPVDLSRAGVTRHRNLFAAWAVAGAVAIGAPFLWGQYPVIPALPPEIAALQVPGKLTIVSFTDFQCPYCRALHSVVHELLEGNRDRVAIVRRMMPLASHEGALPAALAYECVPEARRDAMVETLYGAPPPLLTTSGTIAMAEALELDRARFAKCLGGDEAKAAVDRDTALFKQVGGSGLPHTFVGKRVILGFNEDRIRTAIELGLAGEQPSLPQSFLFAVLALVFAGAAGITWRAGE